MPRARAALAHLAHALVDLTGLAPQRLSAPAVRSDRSRVIAIAGSKGGSGKTTLAANLGVAWFGAGTEVLLIDADASQQSLAAWGAWRRRRFGEQAAPSVASAPAHRLARTVDEARALGWGVIVVDLPGGDLALSSQILNEADLILVAARPTPFDLRAAIALGRRLRDLGAHFRFVLTQVPPTGGATESARAKLAPIGRTLNGALAARVVYQHAIACGAGVSQLTRPHPAILEVGELLGEVRKLFTEART
jgi:chromosome partitioning protein